MPVGVVSTQPDVYWNVWPGASRGCSPTTPSPRTSSTEPRPSVMIQWRVRSWALIEETGYLPLGARAIEAQLEKLR